MRKGRLGYNRETKRLSLLIGDLFEYDFHCGDTLQIEINDKWETTRVEMKGENNWYLVGIKSSLDTLWGNMVKINY